MFDQLLVVVCMCFWHLMIVMGKILEITGLHQVWWDCEYQREFTTKSGKYTKIRAEVISDVCTSSETTTKKMFLFC